MPKVHKYPVPLEDNFDLELPKDSEILAVQVMRGEPFMWVLLDPEAPMTRCRFRVAGTGHDIGHPMEDLVHMGSFQMHDGSLIFHVFEILE